MERILAFIDLLAWFVGLPAVVAGGIKFYCEFEDFIKTKKVPDYGGTRWLLVALVCWAWILSH